METYITKNLDTDTYLYEFINIRDLLTMTQINKSIYLIIHTIPMIKQYLESDEKYIVDFACKNNHVELLNSTYNLSNIFTYSQDALLETIDNNHLEIFEWFEINNIELECTNILKEYARVTDKNEIYLWFKTYKYDYDLGVEHYRTEFVENVLQLIFDNLKKKICTYSVKKFDNFVSMLFNNKKNRNKKLNIF